MEIRPELLLPVGIALGVLVEKLLDLRAKRRVRRRPGASGPPRDVGARVEAEYGRKAA